MTMWPSPCALMYGQRGADQVGRAQDVRVDHRLPVGRVGVAHVAFDVDAGVGHREVDLAVGVEAGLGEALHVVVAAARRPRRPIAWPPAAVIVGHQAVDVGLGARAADELRAEAGELAGHRLADALAGAGDHAGPARQVELDHLPLTFVAASCHQCAGDDHGLELREVLEAHVAGAVRRPTPLGGAVPGTACWSSGPSPSTCSSSRS